MPALTEKCIALVGFGEPARAYVELLSEFPELRLGGVVATGHETPPAEIPSFRSIGELLVRGEVPQLALICSPPLERAAHAAALLWAGVDVLITPPLACEPDEADRIATMAELSGRTAYTAAPLRALPALREARRCIDSGGIGRLCALECDLSEKREPPDASALGGVWLESGPHAIDLVETLAGCVQRIRMLSRSTPPGDPRWEDEASVEVEHASGVVSRVRLSRKGEHSAPIARCIGDRGELIVGRARTLLIAEGREPAELREPYSEREAHREVLRDFLVCCRAVERPVDHGAQSVAWIQAAYRSLAHGGWEIC